MLRTIVQVTGLARALGDLRFRLEDRAERAVAQVKGIAVRIAIAAALAIAAVIFTLLALIAGLIILFAYLRDLYGDVTALAIVGGALFAVALACVLAAALIGRGKSKREPDSVLREETEDERRRRESRAAMMRTSHQTDALDSLVTLTSAAQRRNHRAFAEHRTMDAVHLLQTGDRRTILAVVSAVAAIGWLMGRTMPRASRH